MYFSRLKNVNSSVQFDFNRKKDNFYFTILITFNFSLSFFLVKPFFRGKIDKNIYVKSIKIKTSFNGLRDELNRHDTKDDILKILICPKLSHSS
jgi:hypothetical protein